MVFISSKLYHKKGDLAPLFGAKSSFFIAPFFHSPLLYLKVMLMDISYKKIMEATHVRGDTLSFSN